MVCVLEWNGKRGKWKMKNGFTVVGTLFLSFFFLSFSILRVAYEYILWCYFCVEMVNKG